MTGDDWRSPWLKKPRNLVIPVAAERYLFCFRCVTSHRTWGDVDVAQNPRRKQGKICNVSPPKIGISWHFHGGGIRGIYHSYNQRNMDQLGRNSKRKGAPTEVPSVHHSAKIWPKICHASRDIDLRPMILGVNPLGMHVTSLAQLRGTFDRK